MSSSTSGGAWGSGAGRLRRHAPSHGPLGSRAGGAESGGYSDRNAVVVRPARTTGWATSQRRNGEVRRQPLDRRLGERVAQAEQRLVAGRAMRDQLRDHRVVGDPDLVALLDSGVDADARRKAEALDAARLRQEALRILRVEPRLDGVPLEARLEVERLAGCDAQLLADDVDARHELGHRVLDLDAAVQLEEVEVAPVEHELDGAGAAVADRAAERDRGLAHARPELAVERGGGRLLEDLLVPALNRAVALAEGDDLAVPVGEQLDLDVARPLDVALVVDGVVAERGFRLAAGGLRRLLELGRLANDAHAAAASAGGCLDDQRVADLVRLTRGEHGHAGLVRDSLRLELVAALAQRVRRRPDEDEPGRLDRLGEVGILGQEAVARMDRVRADALGSADVLFRGEVALDLDRLVGDSRVEGASVVGRGHGDGRDPGVGAGTEDPGRDLAAVRYEELSDLHRTANVIRAAPESSR